VAAQGTALTDDHARLLKRYADSVIIALDADKAGQDASMRSAEALLGAGLSVSIAALPKGDDPDSLIRKNGGQAFLDVVKNAKSVIEFQVDVFSARESITTQEGILRATQAVLETMAKVPTETQRHILFRQAWKKLGMKEEALRDTYSQFLKKRQKPFQSPGNKTPAPVQYPTEEVALAELLCSHGSVADLVREHLPLDLLTDPTCRKIIEHLLNHPDVETGNLSGKLAGEDAECQRLAAQIQMSPSKIVGKESTPESAAKDMILVIWKKTFERRQTELRRQMESITGVEKERLDIQGKQLTLDIKTIQQGWKKALPILEL
jgi:DNA primase